MLNLTTDPRVTNDPKVKALLANIQGAKTTKEALEYHLLLDKFLFQERSLLDDPRRREELGRLQETAEERDRAAEAFENDRVGFVENVFDRSEKRKLTGEKAEQARATAGKMMREAVAGRLAGQRLKAAALDYDFDSGPRVDVNATGTWIKVGSGPNAQPFLQPERIRIGHREWILTPGLNRNTPKIVADRYEQILVSRSETAEREKAMGASPNQDGVRGMEATALEAKLREIDKRYGVRRQLPA